MLLDIVFCFSEGASSHSSGQFIIRLPSVIEGKPIDIQRLGEKHMTSIITEGTAQVRDPVTGKYTTTYQQGKKEMNAGFTANAGAITLIRPEPGSALFFSFSSQYIRTLAIHFPFIFCLIFFFLLAVEIQSTRFPADFHRQLSLRRANSFWLPYGHRVYFCAW